MTSFDIHNPWNIPERLPGSMTRVVIAEEVDQSLNLMIDSKVIYMLSAEKVKENKDLLMTIGHGIANYFNTELEVKSYFVSENNGKLDS